MPGRAAHTAGMAFTAGRPGHDHAEHHVVLERRRHEVGRREDLELGAHARLALDLDEVAVLDLPVGLEGRTLAPAHVEVDHLAAVDPALPARGDAGHAAGVDRPRVHDELLGGLGELGHARTSSKVSPEGVAHQADRVAEHRGAAPTIGRERGVVDRTAEADGSSVSGESYPVESTDSSTVTESTRSHSPADTMPSRLANPGLMPEPKIELPPRSHASMTR